MTDDERMMVGYGRVSTLDQDPQMQVEALVRYGVPRDQIYTEKASGATMDRPVLRGLMKLLPRGSRLVVWKLDRLGRTLMGLCEAVEEMEKQGIDLVIVTENIDTSTPMGRLTFQISGAFAEFERNIIAERTAEGMKRKMETGWKPGRRAIIPNSPKLLLAFQRLYDSGEYAMMTNREVYERMMQADPKVECTFRTYVKWKHDGHPGAELREEPPLNVPDT